MYAPISDAAWDNHYLCMYTSAYGHDYFDATYDDLDVIYEDDEDEVIEDEEIELEVCHG